MLQVKKLSEMFIKLPRAARLVKDEVGIRPGLFTCKCHAGHVGWESLVNISIVTEAKSWFVYI